MKSTTLKCCMITGTQKLYCLMFQLLAMQATIQTSNHNNMTQFNFPGARTERVTLLTTAHQKTIRHWHSLLVGNTTPLVSSRRESWMMATHRKFIQRFILKVKITILLITLKWEIVVPSILSLVLTLTRSAKPQATRYLVRNIILTLILTLQLAKKHS